MMEFVMNYSNLLPVLFVFIWLGMMYLFSCLSGWGELARHYRYRGEVILKKRYCQTVRLRLVSYGSCVTVGCNGQGLFLSTMFIFVLGPAKLFIPWSDIRLANKTSWGIFPVLELSVEKVPAVKILLFRSWGKLFQEFSSTPLKIE